MLVLNRKPGQSIMVGDIEILVTEVRGEQVRLGISAPGDVAVHRKEIYLAARDRNRAAAQTSLPSTGGAPADEIRRQP